MREVWFLFKIIQLVMSCVCLHFHMIGFAYKLEPLPHVIIYCGTFVGFASISIFGIVTTCLGMESTVFKEAIINSGAAFLYILASLMSLFNAENDFHLMYLSDKEEPLHVFYRNCIIQSKMTLATASVHLLNAVLAIDALHNPATTPIKTTSIDDLITEEDPLAPIKLYFLGKSIHTFLYNNSRFFRHISDTTNEKHVLKE